MIHKFISFVASSTTLHQPPILPKLILLDRDGVVNEDVGSPGVTSPSQLRLTPGAASAIGRLRRRSCRVALITNQSCVGKGLLTEHGLDKIHDTLRRMLLEDDEDAIFDGLYQCLSIKEDNDPRMKPGPGMILEALHDFGAEVDDSIFIGDNLTDLQAASAAGVDLKMLVSTTFGPMSAYTASQEPSLVCTLLNPDMDSVTPFIYAKNLDASSAWLCGDYACN